DYIQELLVEKIAGTISKEDNMLVEEALATDRSVQLLWEVLSDQFKALEGEDFLKSTDVDTAWLQVAEKLDEEVSRQSAGKIVDLRNSGRLTIKKISVAAVCILAVGIGSYFFLAPKENEWSRLSERSSQRVPMSGTQKDRDKVVLTLANGKTIVLDSAENGVLVKTGDIEVSKTADGQLIYQVTQAESDYESTGVNTITTPPGGQYQIILPDH